MGFKPIPPYRSNPVPGADFLELELQPIAAVSGHRSRVGAQGFAPLRMATDGDLVICDHRSPRQFARQPVCPL